MIVVADGVQSARRGVYCISNLTLQDRVYVGSSLDISLRIRAHMRDLIVRKHANRALQADYDQGHEFRISRIRSVHPLDHLRLIEQDEIEGFRAAGYTLYNVAAAFTGDRARVLEVVAGRWRDLLLLYQIDPDLAVIASRGECGPIVVNGQIGRASCRERV